jgi:hypothetical protein
MDSLVQKGGKSAMVTEVIEGEVGKSFLFNNTEYWISDKTLNPNFDSYPLTKNFFMEDCSEFKGYWLSSNTINSKSLFHGLSII